MFIEKTPHGGRHGPVGRRRNCKCENGNAHRTDRAPADKNLFPSATDFSSSDDERDTDDTTLRRVSHDGPMHACDNRQPVARPVREIRFAPRCATQLRNFFLNRQRRRASGSASRALRAPVSGRSIPPLVSRPCTDARRRRDETSALILFRATRATARANDPS